MLHKNQQMFNTSFSFFSQTIIGQNQCFNIRKAFPGRKYVTSDKVSFRSVIRQNFYFEKNQDIKSLFGS